VLRIVYSHLTTSRFREVVRQRAVTLYTSRNLFIFKLHSVTIRYTRLHHGRVISIVQHFAGYCHKKCSQYVLVFDVRLGTSASTSAATIVAGITLLPQKEFSTSCYSILVLFTAIISKGETKLLLSERHIWNKPRHVTRTKREHVTGCYGCYKRCNGKTLLCSTV